MRGGVIWLEFDGLLEVTFCGDKIIIVVLGCVPMRARSASEPSKEIALGAASFAFGITSRGHAPERRHQATIGQAGECQRKLTINGDGLLKYSTAFSGLRPSAYSIEPSFQIQLIGFRICRICLASSPDPHLTACS